MIIFFINYKTTKATSFTVQNIQGVVRAIFESKTF